MKKSPELLAPAGNKNSLIAAINGGADAVYLGLSDFSARKKAGNFTLEELEEAVKLSHESGVKVYVVINTLIKDKELNKLIKTLQSLENIEIDGLIVQDIGLIWLLKKYFPEFSLQLSTQASVYGLEGARFFDDLGFSRVVLARESGINEVKKMKEELNTEIKIFNHGALCYAYSGQCHLSSSIGKRSGNRGTCAQPCRKFYTLTKEDKVLKEGFLLSTKDLSTLDHTNELINSKADALKIEGRLKSPEYVYSVTKAYRDKLDKNRFTNEKEVRAVFNRDFTSGRLFGNTHNLSQSNPKKRGELIGIVKSTKNNKALIDLKDKVKLINGDGISFGKSEEKGMFVNAIFDLNNKRIKEGRKSVYIKTDLDLKPGTKVFRSFNKTLMDNLKKEALKAPEKKKVPIDLKVTIKKDKPVEININKNNQNYLFKSSTIPQKALKRELKNKDIEKQFSKLGDTVYELKNINIDLDRDLFLSIKELNELRRESLKLLEPEKKLKEDKNIKLKKIKKEKVENPLLSLKFDNLADSYKGLNIPCDEVVITIRNFDDLTELKDLTKEFEKQNKKVLLTTDIVIHSDLAKKIKDSGFLDLVSEGFGDGYLVKNYEILEMLKNYDVFKEADISFNIFNHLAGLSLKEWGFNSAVLSDELNKDEIYVLSQNFSIPTVLNIAGNRELMVSANCVFDCPNCNNCQNEGFYELNNKNGDEFFLKVEDKKNYIYNKKLTINAEAYKNQPFIDKFRIQVLNQDEEEIKQIIKDLNSNNSKTLGNYLSGVE